MTPPIFVQAFAIAIIVLLVTGCRPAQSSDAPFTAESEKLAVQSPASKQLDSPAAPPPDREFQDVLNQYMGLNERLDRIASRLKISNVDLCPKTESDIGLTTHTLSDYPEELRLAARYYLNVDEDMSIRTIRAQSPAAKAGLLAGDRILALNGESLIEGPLFSNPQLKGAMGKALFHTGLNKLNSADTARITVNRRGKSLTKILPITRQCKLPVTLFFSEDINGHYVNGEIWMTSGLLQTVSEDIRIAYIMAHEMAHALHHDAQERTPQIELDADRAGLILLARAGYDPAELASFWAEQLYLFDGGDSESGTHPDLKRRVDNFALTLSYIRAAQEDKDKLKALITTPE